MELIRAIRSKAEHTFYVSPNFHDNYQAHEFGTIQAAIDYVYDNIYSELKDQVTAIIFVYPGRYKEQIHSYEYIRLKAFDDSYVSEDRSVILFNDGIDRDSYVLKSGVDYNYHIQGFNIETYRGSDDRIITDFNRCTFINCVLQHGSFVENTIDSLSCSMSFFDCVFWAVYPFKMEGVRAHSGRTVFLNGCWVYGKSPYHSSSTLESTHATGTGAVFEMQDTKVVGNIDIGGDWDFVMNNSRTRRSTTHVSGLRNTYDTTGSIHITNAVIGNGLHFKKDASDKIIHGVDFNDADSVDLWTGEADITADVTIPIVDYVQNIQQNGISGEIQIIDPIKPVGANAVNRYQCIQYAIDSISVKGVVDLNASFTGLSELIIPTGINITIDGHKLYSLSFTSDIVTLNTSEELVFFGLTELSGNEIEINGNSSYIGFEECLTVNAYITLTSGTNTYCLIYTSTIKAPSGYPAITHNNANSVIISGYSRIDGGVGHPAIKWTVDADNKFKCKFSTLLHGDGGANAPLLNIAVGKVDISVYNTGLNATWDANKFTNLIVSANNTIDSAINF